MSNAIEQTLIVALMAWGARNLISTQEYWTYGQRDAIERARRRGVHLNFWSANEAYWAVRFEGRTMICYKETQNTQKRWIATTSGRARSATVAPSIPAVRGRRTP